MRKTLVELAETKIVNLHHDPGSIFHPDDPTSKVLGYFKDTGVYEAVASDGSNTGLITVRDLLGVDHPQRTKLKSVWEQIGTVNSNNSMEEVVNILIDNDVRAMPLVDGGTLKGIISQVDFLSELIQVKELGQVKVKELMNIPVISVDLETGNDRARRLMLDNDISHLPVLKDEKLEGIVTAEILVHTFIVPASRMSMGNKSGQMGSGFSGQVGGVMDSQPLTVGLEENVLEVITEMTQRNKSACLVVDQEKVLGIITPRELLQPIYELRGKEELPVYIVGLSGEEDWFDAAVAENKIRRVVMRAQSMYPNLREIRVHIESQNIEGNRSRYEVRAHIYMKQGSDTIFVKQEGWDLLTVFDSLTQALDQMLRDSKTEREMKPRHGRQRRSKPSFNP